MIIKLYEDKELTKLDRFSISSNTSKEEIIDFIKKENLDFLFILKLVTEANDKGINLTIYECLK